MLKLPASTVNTVQSNGEKHRRRRRAESDRTRQTPTKVGYAEEFSTFNRFEHSIGDHRSSRGVKHLYSNDENYFDCPSSRSAIIDDEHRAIVELESEIQLVKQSLHSLYHEIKGEHKRRRRHHEKPSNNNQVVTDQSNRKSKQQQQSTKKPETSDEIMRRCLKEKEKCYRNIQDNLFILKNLDNVMSILRSDDDEAQNVWQMKAIWERHQFFSHTKKMSSLVQIGPLGGLLISIIANNDFLVNFSISPVLIEERNCWIINYFNYTHQWTA